MAVSTITVRPYTGSLIAANLLSAQRTIVLNFFGSQSSGALSDNDGLLSTADNGTATFNGQALTYIGSGTVQAGASVLGVTVGVGPTKPVVLFQVGGQIYFHFPLGEVNLVGAVALITNISSAPYQVFTPICFVSGSLIRTPEGDRPVEDLLIGDLVTDADGVDHEILWVAGRTMQIPLGLGAAFGKLLPVRIKRNAFGPGAPYKDLLVSQQHRILIDGPGLELMFGERAMLAPAKALLGDNVVLERNVREVTYHHILCKKHVILLANGLRAESLFPGPVARDTLTDDTTWDEVTAMFPEMADEDSLIQSVFPVLRVAEAKVVTRFRLHA